MLLFCLLPWLLAAAPVERPVEEGTVDWTARTLRVVGVGTPTILSPTGGLTARDPYEMARDDARGRMARALASVPVDAGRVLGDLSELEERRAMAVRGLTVAGPLHFSDGTVHLPATISLDWVPAALGRTSPRPASAAQVVLQTRGALAPAFRLTLQGAGGQPAISAGGAGDPLAPGGLVYVREAAAEPGALLVEAEAVPGRPGVLSIDASKYPDLFTDRLHGAALVVVVP